MWSFHEWHGKYKSKPQQEMEQQSQIIESKREIKKMAQMRILVFSIA